jgi:putative salt-induced outer membrane protein YdiY
MIKTKQTAVLRTLILLGAFAAATHTVSAQAPTAEAKPGWDTSAALGLTLTRGNSDTLLFTGNLITGKKWDQNEVALGTDFTYGENKVTEDRVPPATGTREVTKKSAETLRGYGQYNRLVSERTYGYVRLEALHDAVARVEYRITLSPGIGYYFIKKEDTRLSGEVGPGFVYEKQGGDAPDGYFTLRLAERFDHKLSDRAKLWQSLEILPQVDDYENCIVNFEIGLESSLTEKLSLRTYIQDTYDNQPADGRDRNDLKLVTALAYKF